MIEIVITIQRETVEISLGKVCLYTIPFVLGPTLEKEQNYMILGKLSAKMFP